MGREVASQAKGAYLRSACYCSAVGQLKPRGHLEPPQSQSTLSCSLSGLLISFQWFAMSSFFDLPFELREKIYVSVLRVQQLKSQNIPDPFWNSIEKPAGIPSLFFVNKAVSEEAAAIFYSCAILNITPLHPPAALFEYCTRLELDLKSDLDHQFAACPPRHLKCILFARVLSGQTDVVIAEAYEALLRWLVDNTAVRAIHLSPRMRTRIRKARTNISAISNLCNKAPNLSLLRTIHVYIDPHHHSRWATLRVKEIRHAMRGASLSNFEVFILDGGEHNALLDPRWDLRRNSTAEEVSELQNVSDWLDHLLNTNSVTKRAILDLPGQSAWGTLHQVCFVFEQPKPDQQKGLPQNDWTNLAIRLRP